MGISPIILASGLSTRMGTNKLLLIYKGKPIVQHVLETVLQVKELEKGVVVANSEDVARIGQKFGFQTVANPNAWQGQSTTLIKGVKAVPESHHMMFFVGDQPLLTTTTVQKLIGAFQRQGDKIIVPRYHGHCCNPVIFPKDLRNALLLVKGDTGGRQVIRNYPERVFYCEMPPTDEFSDIDTQEDYKKLGE